MRMPGRNSSLNSADHLMKGIIVGGVVGGASCAARLRRLDEPPEIINLERGPHVSDGNFDQPCHVGGVTEKEESTGSYDKLVLSFEHGFLLDAIKEGSP